MKNKACAIAAALLVMWMSVPMNAQTPGRKAKGSGQPSPAEISAGSSAVLGSGTPGRLTKWLGSNASGYVIGDSSVAEDKFGNVGVGTTTPTSRLTVQGMIETTLGGYKFPDGTVQTTAANGALFAVSHDDTLAGNGTSASPLGVAAPLTLTGSSGGGTLRVFNTAEFGDGITTQGGYSPSAIGGSGIRATGGGSLNGTGGDGVVASGGNSLNGGSGVNAVGGIGLFPGNSGGVGVWAVSGPGFNGAAQGLAGSFVGDVEVTGNLAKGGGSFKIDHPLDPENKYLYHSFVESPDMKNIYDGVATLDGNGEAIVQMPEWFEALNKDHRYLLTAIGAPAPSLHIAEKLSHNQFKIAGGAPGLEVSWQVTGIRQDAYAKANRIKVEVDKPGRERGYYLHPQAFGQPEEKGVEWARNPEMMRRQKEARDAAQPNQADR